jgi:2-keto-4-pentenoate hydratase
VTTSLAQLLNEARRSGRPLTDLPDALAPADADAAYAVQTETLAQRDARITGWKVGSKSHDGPIQASALPSDCQYPTGATLDRGAYAPLAVEAEVAFRFARSFEPGRAYSEEEVMQAIGSFGATLEIVTSRFAGWPKVEPLWMLADAMSHGALVVGEFVPYRDRFPFVAPSLAFSFDGEAPLADSPAANTCGDPRRLLPWLVNHATSRGITLSPEMTVTTGSYIGMYFPERSGTVVATFEGLPSVSATLA